MCSWEICKVFKNTFFEEYLRKTASAVLIVWAKIRCTKIIFQKPEDSFKKKKERWLFEKTIFCKKLFFTGNAFCSNLALLNQKLKKFHKYENAKDFLTAIWLSHSQLRTIIEEAASLSRW